MFKVMIVDDMEILRRDVKRLKLWGEDSGFLIAGEAADGSDALKKLEDDSFDLIITDIRMPNMDGIELLRIVSEQKLCPVTVLLSDYTEYSYARQGFLYGAFDYLSKPVDEKELSAMLKRIRNHLEEKIAYEQKLQNLAEIAEKNHFLEDETKQIISLLLNGDHENTTFQISSLTEKLLVQYDSDWKKTSIAVQNLMHEIIKEVLKAHSWIEKYLDAEALVSEGFAGPLQNGESIKEAANLVLEQLGTTIGRFAGCHDSKIVKQACEYTLHNIDGEISVKTLSEKLFVNRSYLSETFKLKFGMTLLEYITMVKMERAQKLLQEGNLKSYEIAEKLGYKDAEYFGRIFKKYAGIPLKDHNN